MTKIAYVMSRFPHLPETFILREMNGLRELGWDIAPYPLIFQPQAIIHEQARAWMEITHKLPWISLDILKANLRRAIQNPSLYASLWFHVIWENFRSPKFLARALIIFPKAVKMAELMQLDGVKHIHAHYATHPALAAWIIHKLTGISYSLTAHAHDIYVERAMLAEKFRAAEFVITISEFNRQFLREKLGEWVLPKIHVIHCGVQPGLYQGKPRAHPHEPFEIISIGSLQPYKGQTYLIEACALLQQRGIPFRCRIIGGGELQRTLQTQIDRLGLSAQVQLTGPLPQETVTGILSEADCYVQPSVVTPSGKMEGIPVALMEALASELPTIATDISGIPELIRAGETGLLVPQKEAGALANAIQKIFENRVWAKTLAQAGRNLVLAEFDLDKNCQRLTDIFTQLTSTG